MIAALYFFVSLIIMGMTLSRIEEIFVAFMVGLFWPVLLPIYIGMLIGDKLP